MTAEERAAVVLEKWAAHVEGPVLDEVVANAIRAAVAAEREACAALLDTYADDCDQGGAPGASLYRHAAALVRDRESTYLLREGHPHD